MILGMVLNDAGMIALGAALACWVKRPRGISQDLPENNAMSLIPDPLAEAAPPKPFPVAGVPRRVPWSERRKELEAKHRTKRQRMEAWNGAE